jgi:hypothetical protein
MMLPRSRCAVRADGRSVVVSRNSSFAMIVSAITTEQLDARAVVDARMEEDVFLSSSSRQFRTFELHDDSGVRHG